MKIQSDDIAQWTESLEDFKPEFTPVKCFSLLQFFRLRGKTTRLAKENIEPILYLKYCVLNPKENKYYLRTYRGFDVEMLYFYRPSLTFSGEDVTVESFRRYVDDGNVWLLFTKDQITQTNAMLQRLWRSQLNGDGQLSYKIYLELLKLSIDYEDYKDYGKNLTGFKTMCNQYELKIRELWGKCYKN